MLQQYARFTNITLYAFTDSEGSLSVSGELPLERHMSELKQVVASSKPPVEVVYFVSVIPPEVLELLKTNTGNATR